MEPGGSGTVHLEGIVTEASPTTLRLDTCPPGADCDEVLRDPRSCADRLKSTAAQKAVAQGAQARPFGTPGFLFLDPPDHTRLRGLAQKAFAPKVIKALEADIVTMVDGLLEGGLSVDGALLTSSVVASSTGHVVRGLTSFTVDQRSATPSNDSAARFQRLTPLCAL